MGKKFVNRLESRCERYIHDECLVVIGGDFSLIDANQTYQNLDGIIKWMNENWEHKFNVFYSTPSIYINNLQK